MDRLSERRDGELVELARAGDRSAFAVLLHRHVDAVHDHLARRTGDLAAAERMTRDVFTTALERLDALQQPDRFRPWLLRLAAERVEAARPRRQAPADAEGLGRADPLRLGDRETGPAAAELAPLVWETARTLPPTTLAALDLLTRHGLDAADAADVLGVSRGDADGLRRQVADEAAGTIGTALLVHRSGDRCDRLDALVGEVDVPPVSEDLRRSVERHVEDCADCRAALAALPGPLPAYGALAVVPLGADARAALWHTLDARYPFGPAALAAADGPSTATVLTLSLIAGLALAVAVLGLQLREQLRPTVVEAPEVLVAMPLTEDLGSQPTETPTVITPPATEEETEETIPEVTIEPTETTAPSPSPTPAPPPPSPTTAPSPTPTPSPADTTPPSATILEPQEGAAYPAEDRGDAGWVATVPLSGTATDDVDPPDTLTYRWTTDRAGDPAVEGPQTTIELACQGVAPVEFVTLSLRATDSAGNTGDPASVTIQLTGCPVATPGG